MRLVRVEDAQEGMVVAQTIYGLNGEVLVKRGNEVKKTSLDRLKSFLWEYIYIDDELSKGVEINCTISIEVRNTAIQNLKSLYNSISMSKKVKDGELTYGKLMHQHMVNCLEDVDRILDDIIAEKITLVDLFDIKLLDNYKYAHSVNVCIISLVLGKAIQLNNLELYRLGIGAYFHDIGQVLIPDYIIEKQDKFTDDDLEVMKKHPDLGYQFARDTFYFPVTSFLAILQHHERYDGQGYPHKKSGDEISKFGRIVAIADVFDALTSPKKYRPSLTPAAAFKYILENGGKAFDPKLVKVFVSKVSPYPIGFTLNLDSSTEAIVVENYEDNPLHPKVRIFKENGVLLDEPYLKNI